MSKLILRFTLLVAILACSEVKSERITDSPEKGEYLIPRVVNGTKVKTGRQTFAVALFRRGTYRCVGTLIATRTVLTLARYTRGFNESDWTGRIGSPSATRGRIIHFSQIIPHDGYNGIDQTDDIALFILTENINRDKLTNIISLPRMPIPFIGSAYIVGWTAHEPANFREQHRRMLENLEMNILAASECRNSNGVVFDQTKFMCSSVKFGAVTVDDDGAPLIYGQAKTRRVVAILLGNIENVRNPQKQLFLHTGAYDTWIIERAEGEISFVDY